MSHPADDDVTALLAAASAGDREAEARFVEVVYHQLHKLAAYIMRGESGMVTLQTTALVNEALIHLCGGRSIDAKDQRHFFNTAAQQMRRILIDRARAKRAAKRNGQNVSLEEAGQIPLERPEELVALDDGLQLLKSIDPAAERVVELKYFGGYTDEETAAILEVNVAKVRRDWTYARAWLHEHLTKKR